MYAYRLGLNWRSPATKLHRVATSPSRVGAIEEIKFLYRHGKSWIITTSLGIWSTLCLRDCVSFQVIAQWSPGKALFNGIAVNKDDQSDATIAISVHRDGFVMHSACGMEFPNSCLVTLRSRFFPSLSMTRVV